MATRSTPLQNNLTELWALLHWLYPEVFTEKTSDIFRTAFNLTKGHVSTSVMDDARRLLELIMLRRMKNSAGVDLNLPPKTDVILFVPLSPMQRFWYERLITRADQGLLDELFRGVMDKEKVALEMDARDEELADAQRTEVDTGVVVDEWEESKEIMKKALEQESQQESQGPAWRKLMNLLMQLRKVGSDRAEMGASLTSTVLQSSVSPPQRRTRTILPRRAHHPRVG